MDSHRGHHKDFILDHVQLDQQRPRDLHTSREKRRGSRGRYESMTSLGKSMVNGGWTREDVWVYRSRCNCTPPNLLRWLVSTLEDRMEKHNEDCNCHIGICLSASPDWIFGSASAERQGEIWQRSIPQMSLFFFCTLRLVWISAIYLCQTGVPQVQTLHLLSLHAAAHKHAISPSGKPTLS